MPNRLFYLGSDDKALIFYFLGIKISLNKNRFKILNQKKRYKKYLRRIKTSDKKKILFISHDFSLTGAPLAVFNTARYLHNKGYETLVIAFRDGPLLDSYVRNGIEAVACSAFNSKSGFFIKSLDNFDFIFANTVLTYDIIEKVYDHKPYLWRISEGTDIICPGNRKFDRALINAPKIYAVSEYTKKILKPYNGNVELLIYGIEDKSLEYLKYYDKKQKLNKLKICVIGTYCRRKAQDLITGAYNDLPEKTAEKIEIFFIGKGFNEDKPQKNVHFSGEKLDHEKYKILAQCDVLFCPSLDDPNPQVVMEAMMMKKPCVISENVGQKDYITNGVDGFVLKTGSVEEIKNAMTLLAENPQIIDEMSERSYELYKKHFRFEDYINKVISVIEEQPENINTKR